MKLRRNEKVKDVKGFEGLYVITSLGRVWSVRRKKWLVPFYVGSGYGAVSLCDHGDITDKKVHRLVAEAFILNPEGKRCVNHINGKKWDNRASNLEWCTSRENNQHASDMGLNKCFKLSYADKVLICQIFHTFETKKIRLATIFGVSTSAICYIIKTYSPILGLA